MQETKSPYRWVIAGLLFTGLMIMQMSFSCLPPLFSEISRDIPMDKTRMGLIFSMISLAGIIFSLIGGAISDRFGSRTAICCALLITALFGGLRSFSETTIGLAALTFAVGAGLALVPPNVAKVMGSRFSKDELGMANGIVMAATPIGVGVGIGAGASVLSPLFGGWRGALGFVAVLCVTMGMVWILLYRELKPAQGAKDGGQNILENLKDVTKIKDVWLVAVICGIFFYVIGSLMGLLPIVFEERGINRSGEMAALVMLAGVISGPLVGMASDRSGKRKPFLAASAIVMGVCIPSLLSLTGPMLVAAVIVVGLAQGVMMPIMLAVTIELKQLGPSRTATAVGLIMTVGGAIGFLGPLVSGRLMDLAGSPWPAFFLMAAILIAGAAVVIPLESDA
ncbi:MAG: MFS transporter [Deltaproteobacteria bacterium]|nr:MFS transporter [Deltaproteobacteria bacterium]